MLFQPQQTAASSSPVGLAYATNPFYSSSSSVPWSGQNGALGALPSQPHALYSAVPGNRSPDGQIDAAIDRCLGLPMMMMSGTETAAYSPATPYLASPQQPPPQPPPPTQRLLAMDDLGPAPHQPNGWPPMMAAQRTVAGSDCALPTANHVPRAHAEQTARYDGSAPLARFAPPHHLHDVAPPSHSFQPHGAGVAADRLPSLATLDALPTHSGHHEDNNGHAMHWMAASEPHPGPHGIPCQTAHPVTPTTISAAHAALDQAGSHSTTAEHPPQAFRDSMSVGAENAVPPGVQQCIGETHLGSKQASTASRSVTSAEGRSHPSSDPLACQASAEGNAGGESGREKPNETAQRAMLHIVRSPLFMAIAAAVVAMLLLILLAPLFITQRPDHLAPSAEHDPSWRWVRPRPRIDYTRVIAWSAVIGVSVYALPLFIERAIMPVVSSTTNRSRTDRSSNDARKTLRMPYSRMASSVLPRQTPPRAFGFNPKDDRRMRA